MLIQQRASYISLFGVVIIGININIEGKTIYKLIHMSKME